ncbi:uncharacterized protein K460DRAFT_326720 [Cucurbitaria berberidis CBS 394.84]|uniref:Heterokaryon incompatibility domain-containing protein n=1 Tax=Cucurbitaria berberidis CBS 394.84 TaxID=1168544 RepID=A0A9P4GP95_9PLEO|nr:uncharacterized protein K460DRAFT_326720 [Cucurbitaria berberidis CBS 394.84]KAF1850143.1 hypothetical protein K460DRAFT_326720 [Cucurbitaria berberidis CBS 394.84]
MGDFNSFKYLPLPGPNYIRLLHLEPASNNPAELRGYLKAHELNAQSEYEAISYAWGDYPESNRPIFLNNQVLKITFNLYAALMAYSYPDRTRILWADAVCINQADTAEKSQQVAIMSHIYSKAKSVQIWLTLASKAATDAMNFMRSLSLQAESFGISAEAGFLLSRSWFNRVWVVQEVTLAKKLEVSCGHSTMDWTNFARALEVLRGAIRQVPQGEARSKVEGVKPAWELVRLRDAFRLIDRHSTRHHHLMTNLVGRQMSNKACTDDRDRVYAMLAMTNSPYSMSPDYGRTVAEAYTEFTRRYSPNTQIYWAGLCRRKLRSSLESTDTSNKTDTPLHIDIMNRDYLPSWVPEFRPSLNLAWASPFTGTYRVAKGAPFHFSPHPTVRNIMYATGAIFDTIVTASWEYKAYSPPLCMYDPGFYFSVIDQLQAILCFPINFGTRVEVVKLDQIPEQQIQPTSEPRWLILAKTLTGGVGDCFGAEFLLSRYSMFVTLNHLEPGSVPWLNAIWDCFARHCLAPTGEVFQHVILNSLGVGSRPLSEDGKIADGFLGYLANILVPNRLFITTKGHIGLASRDIRSMDLVTVFNGCHMPYVVRPARKVKCKNDLAKGAVQVIGPCYLHGIMNGEIFKDRHAPQFSKLRWTRRDGDPVDSLKGWITLI